MAENESAEEVEVEEQEEKSSEKDEAAEKLAAAEAKARELEAKLASASETNARLDERLKALEKASESKAKEPERTYSRKELRSLVDDGKLSEDEMEEILDRQRESRILREAEARASRIIEQQTRSMTVSQQLRQYREARPDAFRDGTEDREKVRVAFNELVELGDDPNDERTDLKALRMAFGPPRKIEERSREAHLETGAATRESEGRGSGIWRDIPAETRKHWEKMIERGYYKGEDDPILKKELNLFRKKKASRKAA